MSGQFTRIDAAVVIGWCQFLLALTATAGFLLLVFVACKCGLDALEDEVQRRRCLADSVERAHRELCARVIAGGIKS